MCLSHPGDDFVGQDDVVETYLPERIFLVRHGESEGNVNRTIYETVPDNAIHLTKKGWDQGTKAGSVLLDIIGQEPVIFAVSSYVRTRETFNAIQSAGSFNVETWHEDARLREQDFGNFQDTKRLMAEFAERKDFGKFYYRHPQGESPADVYDRISSFMDSLFRMFKQSRAKNYVIVTHGVTMRLFLMRWLRQSVDDFHNTENPGNSEIHMLERQMVKGKATLAFTQVIKPAKDPPMFLLPGAIMKPEAERSSREIREVPPAE